MLSSIFSRISGMGLRLSSQGRQALFVSSLQTLKKTKLQRIRYDTIHTTPQRLAVPPIFMIVLRPIAKISAMVFGRVIRKWWQRLPEGEKKRILNRIRGKQTQIALGGISLSGIGFIYYLNHVEEEPLTKRTRFMLYNNEQMLSIAQMEFDNQISTFRPEIVPPSHPIYNRIVRVANRILSANNNLQQVKDIEWAVTVVDRPDVINAFVLPHGKIMVFTGILNIASNDDQLAIVLAHEMSHAILGHMREALSKTIILEMVFLIPLVVIWALLPDAAALFSQWLSNRLADIIIHLPFNRAIEMEADVVGLELAARACYDIREAPVFWAKMAEISDSSEPVEWLSTHPSHESRQLELSQLIPAALGIRDSCQCPRLPPTSTAQKLFIKAV